MTRHFIPCVMRYPSFRGQRWCVPRTETRRNPWGAKTPLRIAEKREWNIKQSFYFLFKRGRGCKYPTQPHQAVLPNHLKKSSDLPFNQCKYGAVLTKIWQQLSREAEGSYIATVRAPEHGTTSHDRCFRHLQPARPPPPPRPLLALNPSSAAAPPTALRIWQPNKTLQSNKLSRRVLCLSSCISITCFVPISSLFSLYLFPPPMFRSHFLSPPPPKELSSALFRHLPLFAPFFPSSFCSCTRSTLHLLFLL